MYVTLKSLRQERACYNGYNKVVRHLQGKPFTSEDEERESYIRYAHDDPISLITIVESNGLQDAIWALRCVPNIDRDARLFAVWCARQVQHLMTDQRSIDALDIAEKFANGESSESELAAARDAARAAEWDAARAAARDAARAAARDAARAAARAAARDAEWNAARAAGWAAARAAARDAEWNAARAAGWGAVWGAVLGAVWGAAWDAAWGAARAAELDAARAEERDAVWGAAWYAARASQKEMFIKMCKGEAPWQK